MIGVRWHKVFNDLGGNKTRTMLIILSIGVGLLAVGTIINSRTTLSTEMARSFAAINPSDGTVRTLEPFDEEFVRSIQDMPGVKEADARRIIEARIQLSESGKWTNLTIFAVADYNDMRVNKIKPQSGAWPPPSREILIERSAMGVIHAKVGDTIRVEMPNERERSLRIAGTVHDLAQLPAQIDNSPYGYVSFETLEWFGEPYGYNELHIVVDETEKGKDIPESVSRKEFAQQVVNQVKNKVERSGLTIPMSMTTEPGQIPLDDILQAILLIMGVLGMLSLFLSAFLIINTVSALLAQQKRQIGVMKALGARTGQIMGMYLCMVIFYGLIALILAVPLSILGSRVLSSFLAGMFNFDLAKLKVLPEAILIQVFVGLVVPLLSSILPFLSNLRASAAEAMNTYQMSKGRFGPALIDRLLSGKRLWFARGFLMRPVLLSIRNTFRSKWRLTLTLITLTLASAIFVSVFSVRASLFRTIDDLMMMWNFDTMVVFTRPIRTQKIAAESNQVPGVRQTDGQIQLVTRRVRPDRNESGMIYLSAPRADSELSGSPRIISGRWLAPGDENALVVSTNFLQEEPDVHLGDDVVLRIQGKNTTWRVVGVSLGFILPMAYANYPYVANISGRSGKADAALISVVNNDGKEVERVTQELETQFERTGLRVSSVTTIADERSEADTVYGIIIALMMIMAILLAVVGGLGLMGTMSINVLERTREIGVLRAIGAPNRGVVKVFIFEGITIGLMSWLLGSLLAYPLGKAFSDAVGFSMAAAPLTYTFSTSGVWAWLIISTLLSALASFLPARSASSLTVREVLAYE